MDLWCDQRLVVRVTSPDGCQLMTMDGPFARVGSHPRSDIVLPGTAKRTLYFHATSGGVYCLDLRDHREAHSELAGRWIGPNAAISVENYSLQVVAEPAGKCCESPPPLLSRNNDLRSAVAFRIHCKRGPKAKYKLHRALTVVGRDTTCGLNLSGTKVSSPHCVLYCDQGRTWFVDLLSNNGTLLNGQRCEAAEIRPGDRLTVGEFRLTHTGQAGGMASAAANGQTVFSSTPAKPSQRTAPIVESPVLEEGDPSTVQLSKGDTIDVALCAQSRNECEQPQEDSKPNAVQSNTCADARDGTGPLVDEAVDEAMAKFHVAASLTNEIRGLTQQLEEQQKQFAALRGALEAEQKRWQAERDCLRFELTTQANIIAEQKRDLVITRAQLDRQLNQIRAAVASHSLRSERVADRNSAERELVAGAIVSQGVSLAGEEAVGVAYTRISREVAAENGARAGEPPSEVGILGWFPAKGDESEDRSEARPAEGETIQNVESVHSTVVWQQLQQAMAEQSKASALALAGTELAIAAARATNESSDSLEAEKFSATDPLLTTAESSKDRRTELSQFVHERLHELQRSRIRFSRVVVAGTMMALAAAGVFAAWWWQIF